MNLKNILAIGCFGALVCAPAFAASNLSKDDKAFLDTIARTDMTEAHVGQIAEQKAEASDVKDFGQQLVQDHTTDYQNLSQLADKVGEQIPKGIDAKRDKSIVQLENLKGKSFDRHFLQEEIQGHKRAIAECKHEAEHGDNVDVKMFATKIAPTLQEHLQKAEDLAKPTSTRASR